MKFAKNSIELNTRKVPVVNIRQLTDEEWNRLAYRNMLERQAKADVKS